MRGTAFLCLFALMLVILLGCQAENEAAEAEEVLSELEAPQSEALLVESDIAKVELSEKKGVDPVVYEGADELDILKRAISSAIRQPGIVNMAAPEFYLKVVMADGDEQYLQLWLGGEGETAALMNTDDRHTIYSVTTAFTVKLHELLEE